MKHLYIIIISYLFCLSLANAQPNIPLEFKKTQPTWLHYSYDPNLPRFLQLHEQEGKPLIINKDIYLLHNITNNMSEGYLVENIDVETGLAKWRNSYYATKFNTRRYAVPLTQRGDKISMHYFQEWNKELPWGFWRNSRFRRIDYCANSGKKCDSLITNVNDSLNATLMMPSIIFDPYTYRTYLFEQNNKVRYIKHQASYDKTTKQNYLPFYILDLDSLGHKIDSNYIQINTKYAVRNVVLKEYQKGKYVCSVFADNAQKSNTSPKEVKLVYFDANFKIEKTVDITSFLPKFYGCSMAYIDKDNILLWVGTEIIKNGQSLFKITGVLFKSSGEFVKSVSFDNYEIDTDNDENFNLTYLPSTKQIVLINTRKTNADKIINMEVLATNDKGQFDLLKTVPINVNGSTGIYDVTSIGDSSLLCRYKYVDPTSRNEFDAAVKWSVWALFPFSSLGFSTSSKEIVADNPINYYPNPTSNLLNINSKEAFNEIKVYSIEGRLIKKETNTDNTLNTDALPSGIYFFELWQSDKIVSHKLKFVKIE